MRKVIIVIACVSLLMAGLTTAYAASKEVPRITKEEALKLLDNKDVIFVDVRKATDWRASEFMIKGAVRVNATKFDEWMKKYPTDKRLIFYCA